MLNPYTKAVLAAMLVLITSLITGVEDGSSLTTSEIVIAVVGSIAALGAVWATHHTIKWLVSGLTAGLTSFATAIQDGGISTQEYLVIAGAALTALVAVYSTSNTSASNAPRVV